MPTSYLMQAKSSADGELYSWTAGTADFAGVGYAAKGYPGTPLDVVIYSAPYRTPSSVAVTPITCAITSPTAGASLTVGVTTTITVSLNRPGTVVIKKGLAVLATIVASGLSASCDYTPASGDIGSQTINATATDASNGTTADATGVAVTVSASVAFPSAITPVLRFDANAPAYSDLAGTTLATAFTGRVRRIDQVAPASGQITAPSDSARPWRENGALNFEFGDQPSLSAPIAATCTQNALTIAVNFSLRYNAPGGGQYLIHNTAGVSVLSFSDNFILVKYNGGTNWFLAQILPGAAGTLLLRFSPTGISATTVIDGVRTDTTLTATIANTSLPGANWYLGWDGSDTSSRLHGAMAHAVVVASTLSDANAESLLTWLAANPAPHFCPPQIPAVVITGDSIAAGLLLEADRSLLWAYLAQKSLNATQPVNMIIAANSGNTIATQRTTYYPTRMLPFYNAARSRNIFVGAIGTNDIATSSHDGPTVLADYYSYMDLAKAAGFRIVVCTILPRSGTSNDTAFDAARAYFNTHLRAEWASRGYSALADVATISGMGADGDDANTTYYADAIHPTFTGDALMAPVYAAAIQTAIN